MKKLTIKERLDKRNVPGNAIITVVHSVDSGITLYHDAVKKLPKKLADRYPFYFKEVCKNTLYRAVLGG